MKIENETLKKEFTAMANALTAKKVNLSNEAVAAVIVRTIFGETDPEYLTPEHADHRKALVALIRPLITAPNNIQNNILADTMREDGVTPIMQKVSAVKAASLEEFV